MKFRTILLALALLLLGLFVALNWAAFMQPSSLSLGFTQVQAPLGLSLLLITGALSALFLIYILMQQASLLLETRRFEKEMRSQRDLADKAEASRFTELQQFLTQEMSRLREEHASRLEEASGALAAHLGELEDKLDKALAPR